MASCGDRQCNHNTIASDVFPHGFFATIKVKAIYMCTLQCTELVLGHTCTDSHGIFKTALEANS